MHTAKLAFEYPPREERFPVEIDAELHLFGGTVIAARLRNLSPAGFRAQCEANVLIGTQLILMIPNVGAVPAQVRWAFHGRLGGLFNGRIAPPVRAALLSLMESEAA